MVDGDDNGDDDDGDDNDNDDDDDDDFRRPDGLVVREPDLTTKLEKSTRYSFYEASAGQVANEALSESKQVPEALPGPSQLLNINHATTNT
ncbi:hypothetical protein MSG28_000316 [Choristoneura fumiferana]|uniref:Uncharacterized protein n=1 Tax=Choristoneura fumiferana TaxID=7141 RepID=A0ACC0JZW7_CHOFU|nr:hypothetical protein MSG28_000316 [Choristoneura fumiferana]